MKSLSVAEMKDFSKYMEGSPHRSGSMILKLLDYLKKNHPEFTEKKLDRDLVHKKISGGKPFHKGFFDLTTLLLKYLEEYLMREHLRKKDLDREILLLDIYKQRKLDKLFFKKTEQLEKRFDGLREGGIEELHKKYLLSSKLMFHTNFSVYHNTRSEVLSTLIRRLDNYYLANRCFQSYCELSHPESLLSPKEGFQVEKLLSLIESINYQLPPEVRISSLMLACINNGDYSDYRNVKKEILESFDHFTKTERADLLSFLQRACVDQYYNKGEAYLAELFDLYLIQLDRGVAVDDGYISSRFFRVFVLVGLALGKIDVVHSFLETYSNFLEKEIKQDTIALCLSVVAFYEQAYHKVISNFSTVKFTDPEYSLVARVFIAQSFYELDDYELLMNGLRSFRAFLDRNSVLSESTKQASYDFIKALQKLMIERYEKNGNFEELEELIVANLRVSSRHWLLKKLAALQ